MKPEYRKKVYKDLNKLANPSIINEERAITTEDLASILGKG